MMHIRQGQTDFSKVFDEIRKILAESKDGADVDIKRHINRRTIDQNRYYWANCMLLSDVFTNAGMYIEKFGLKFDYTSDDVHDLNKILFCIDSTAKMDKKEFSDFMERFFSYWIEKTVGQFVPLPAKDYFERTCYETN